MPTAIPTAKSYCYSRLLAVGRRLLAVGRCSFFLQIANMKVQITSLGMHMRYALGLRHGAICTLPLAFGFGQMAWISTPAAVRIHWC